MKKIFLFPLILLTGQIFSQSSDSARRYIDDLFSNNSVSTVQYGSNINFIGVKETLLADIYEPADDTAANRAMIIIVHGGGFTAGNRHEPAMVFACNKLVKKGYVVASLDYRKGFDKMNPKSLYTAVLRAVQDLNAFIRYTKANAEKLDIDTNKIFITGASAGGVTVLQKTYMKVDNASASMMNIKNEKDVEGDSNDFPNTSSVAGVYSMWGAIFDTSWIQKGDVPVGCVQSRYDHTIPWNSGKYSMNDIVTLYGSNSIYRRAFNLGIVTTLHGYRSVQHDLGIKLSPYRDSTIQFMSEFFYHILNTSSQSDSSRQNKENTVLQRTYLVMNTTYGGAQLEDVQLKHETGDLRLKTMSSSSGVSTNKFLQPN